MGRPMKQEESPHCANFALTFSQRSDLAKAEDESLFKVHEMLNFPTQEGLFGEYSQCICCGFRPDKAYRANGVGRFVEIELSKG